ncbi:hypothetical protein PYCC9005_001478 [Savitreella phatthalungensis]
MWKRKAKKSNASAPLKGQNKQIKAPLALPEQDPWLLQRISLSDCESVVLAVISELKDRALDERNVMTPFRPEVEDIRAARTFHKRVFSTVCNEQRQLILVDNLQAEVKLVDAHVLVGMLRWIFSRVPNGLIDVQKYRIWQRFEDDAPRETTDQMFTDVWKTLIMEQPHCSCFFALLDLISGVCAHTKYNGHDADELVRSISLWFFPSEPVTSGAGFMVGYQTYAAQSQAMKHVFFGYLREQKANSKLGLARALESLLEATAYPPQAPIANETVKLVLSSNALSRSPLSLVKRAAGHKRRHQYPVLEGFSCSQEAAYNLSDECLRTIKVMQDMLGNPDEDQFLSHLNQAGDEWMRFRQLGFDDSGPVTAAKPKRGHKRPVTVDWGNFSHAGFPEDADRRIKQDFLPLQMRVPSCSGSVKSGDSMSSADDSLLVDLRLIEIDKSLRLAWLSSLTYETSQAIKGMFGRCVVLELRESSSWLIVEEVMPEAPRAEKRRNKHDAPLLTDVPADVINLADAERKIRKLGRSKVDASCSSTSTGAKSAQSLKHADPGVDPGTIRPELRAAMMWTRRYDAQQKIEQHLARAPSFEKLSEAPVELSRKPTIVEPENRSLESSHSAIMSGCATDDKHDGTHGQNVRRPSLMKRLGSLMKDRRRKGNGTERADIPSPSEDAQKSMPATIEQPPTQIPGEAYPAMLATVAHAMTALSATMPVQSATAVSVPASVPVPAPAARSRNAMPPTVTRTSVPRIQSSSSSSQSDSSSLSDVPPLPPKAAERRPVSVDTSELFPMLQHVQTLECRDDHKAMQLFEAVTAETAAGQQQQHKGPNQCIDPIGLHQFHELTIDPTQTKSAGGRALGRPVESSIVQAVNSTAELSSQAVLDHAQVSMPMKYATRQEYDISQFRPAGAAGDCGRATERPSDKKSPSRSRSESQLKHKIAWPEQDASPASHMAILSHDEPFSSTPDWSAMHNRFPSDVSSHYSEAVAREPVRYYRGQQLPLRYNPGYYQQSSAVGALECQVEEERLRKHSNQQRMRSRSRSRGPQMSRKIPATQEPTHQPYQQMHTQQDLPLPPRAGGVQAIIADRSSSGDRYRAAFQPINVPVVSSLEHRYGSGSYW